MSNIRGSSDGKHCPRRYTPGDRDEGWIYRSGIDVHRIHSGDDMDKCKIYRGGVVCGYTAGKSVTNWRSACRGRILVEW